MKIIGALLIFLIPVGALISPTHVEASEEKPRRKQVCYSQFQKDIKNKLNSMAMDTCQKLDTSVTTDGSPFVYTNPDAGCDLGFSMPGLPNIGLGLEGIDACKILKAVTGEMVDDVNQQMQDAVDDAVNEVTNGNNEVDVDLGDIIIDEIEVGGG